MPAFDPTDRIVLDLPGMADIVRERIDLPAGIIPTSVADIYRPPDADGARLRPAAMFVHGDADPEMLRGITDWRQFLS